MGKETLYYLYKFSVELYNGNKTFYFAHQEDAKIARLVVYKAFDKQRLSIKGFIPPVSTTQKMLVKENEKINYRILSCYADFENYWFELTEEMCEENKSL